MSEVVIGTWFGILMGPLCAGIFDPRSWTVDSNRVTLEVMRIVLVINLFAAGVHLPEKYMYTDIKGFMTLVVPTMTIGWFIVAGQSESNLFQLTSDFAVSVLLKMFFSCFDYVTCLVLAACLTPTDPVVSAAIVGVICPLFFNMHTLLKACSFEAENLRRTMYRKKSDIYYRQVRDLLYISLDSKFHPCQNPLPMMALPTSSSAYPSIWHWDQIVQRSFEIGFSSAYCVSERIFFWESDTNLKSSLRPNRYWNIDWCRHRQVEFGEATGEKMLNILTGPQAGPFRKSCDFRLPRDLLTKKGMSRNSFQCLFCYGYRLHNWSWWPSRRFRHRQVIVGDTLVRHAYFFSSSSGCALSWNGKFKERVEGQSFAAVIEYILNCGCFFYIGAWLPWKDFSLPSVGISPWRLAIFSIGVLLLRRFPAILALYKWVPQIKNWKQALLCGHFGS